MRLTCFVVWKSWASNPLRTALSVLGVALGVAIVVAIHVMDHNTIESRLRLRRPDFGRVDFELETKDAGRDEDAVRAQLAANSDIAAVGLLQQGVAALAKGGKAEGTVSIYGLSPPGGRVFGHYWVEEGEDLTDLDRDKVLVGHHLARLLGLRPGARLELSRPRQLPRSLCEGGVRKPVEDGDSYQPGTTEVVVKGVLADKRLGHRDQGVMMVVPYGLARETLAPDRRPLFQINRRSGVDVDRLRQNLSSEFLVLDNRSALLGEASDERAFRNGVKVLGCLALVMGMFVIFQTLSQSLVERLKQIGLLRCLGTSRRTIAGVFLLDASATAIAGSVLGVVGGIGLAYCLQAAGLSTLGRGHPVVTFEVPPVPVLWTGALGVLFTLLGAAFPLWKARNLPALQVLGARGLRPGGGRGEVYVLRGVNLFLFATLVVVLPGAYLAMTPLLSEESGEAQVVLMQLGVMVLLFGGVLLAAPRVVQVAGSALLWPIGRWLRLPVFLVRKSLRQSPGRFAASVCGVAVVLMALVALKSITEALKAEARQFGAVAMQDRLFLRTERPLQDRQVAELADIAGVESVDGFRGAVGGHFPLRGLDVAALARPGGVLEGRPEVAEAYRRARGVVISRRLAELRGKRVGDTLGMVTDQGPVSYTVLAVSDAVGFFPDERAWAIAAPKWLLQDFCVGRDGSRELSVQLAHGADPSAVVAAVRGRYEVPWVKSGAEITAYNLRDVSGDFVLFDVLLALILILAGVGMVNTMTIAALGRAREIGVLRALGVSRRQLRTTFLVEGAVVGLLASVLAIGLAVPLGTVVVEGLNRVAGLDAPLVVPWFWVGLVPVLALATGLLAALVPGSRALAHSPAGAVRYE